MAFESPPRGGLSPTCTRWSTIARIALACLLPLAAPACDGGRSGSLRFQVVRASVQDGRTLVIEGWAELPRGTSTLVPESEPFASRFVVNGLRGLAGRPLGPGRSMVCEVSTETGPVEVGPWPASLRTFRVLAPAGPSCAISSFRVGELGIVALRVDEARRLSQAVGDEVARFLADHRDRVVPLAPAAAGDDAPTVDAVRGQVLARAAMMDPRGGECTWIVRPDGVRFTDDRRGTVKVYVAAERSEIEVAFDFGAGPGSVLASQSTAGRDLERYC